MRIKMYAHVASYVYGYIYRGIDADLKRPVMARKTPRFSLTFKADEAVPSAA
jgi:hypothetical protein